MAIYKYNPETIKEAYDQKYPYDPNALESYASKNVKGFYNTGWTQLQDYTNIGASLEDVYYGYVDNNSDGYTSMFAFYDYYQGDFRDFLFVQGVSNLVDVVVRYNTGGASGLISDQQVIVDLSYCGIKLTPDQYTIADNGSNVPVYTIREGHGLPNLPGTIVTLLAPPDPKSSSFDDYDDITVITDNYTLTASSIPGADVVDYQARRSEGWNLWIFAPIMRNLGGADMSQFDIMLKVQNPVEFNW